MAKTAPKLTQTTFSSQNGNPFAAMAKVMHQADMDAAARLRRSRPMREANKARREAAKAV